MRNYTFITEQFLMLRSLLVRNQSGARHGSVFEKRRPGILRYYVNIERYADTSAQGYPRGAMQLLRSDVSILHA